MLPQPGHPGAADVSLITLPKNRRDNEHCRLLTGFFSAQYDHLAMFDFRFALPLCLLVTQAADGATTQWTDLGGMITGTAAVAKNTDGRLEVFVRWEDNSVYHIFQTAAGSSQWSSWSALGGTVASNPAVAVNADGTLDVFALGADNAVWHTR